VGARVQLIDYKGHEMQEKEMILVKIGVSKSPASGRFGEKFRGFVKISSRKK
jgi:hypothetical protein